MNQLYLLRNFFACIPSSLKAKLCVEGNRLSRELFDRLEIPYWKSGKWILATSDAEAEGLEKVAINTKESGGVPLEVRTPEQVIQAMPELKKPVAAMFSPSTAMIDVGSYIQIMDRKLSTFENVFVIHPCKVTAVNKEKSLVETDRGEMPFDIIVNAAGLYADEVYRMAGGTRNVEIKPYKGEYYRWKTCKIKEVVYPVPGRFVEGELNQDGKMNSSLGIHFHCNIAGDVLVGPSQALSDGKYDYSMHLPAEYFLNDIACFFEAPLNATDFEQGYCGNRPKIYEDNKAVGDFLIFQEDSHIHLLGIESPGLTAAPALAQHVLKML